MNPTRRAVLGVVGMSVTGLAGCTDGGSAETTTQPATETTTQPADDPAVVTVQVRDHDEHGEILVDGDGMTLYMFDNDTQGARASACSGGCTVSWPPLTPAEGVAVGDGVTAATETFERDDGAMHVAAEGWPLYYFNQDENPGDAGGQGANDVWWVLGPDGTPQRTISGTDDSSDDDSGDSADGD